MSLLMVASYSLGLLPMIVLCILGFIRECVILRLKVFSFKVHPLTMRREFPWKRTFARPSRGLSPCQWPVRVCRHTGPRRIRSFCRRSVVSIPAVVACSQARARVRAALLETSADERCVCGTQRRAEDRILRPLTVGEVAVRRPGLAVATRVERDHLPPPATAAAGWQAVTGCDRL